MNLRQAKQRFWGILCVLPREFILRVGADALGGPFKFAKNRRNDKIFRAGRS